MSAPTLQPLEGSVPLGTPAAEWAQQTVQAIDPNAKITGLVTDAHGNPTSDHSASAIQGEPGHGVNSDKTHDQLEAIKANAPKATDPIPLAKPEPETTVGNGTAHANTEKPGALFTDLHGNPTSNPNASALEGAPPAPPTPGYAANSTATTPGAQLPGGWIRGPESRQNSMAAPQTSLYEDVSSALDTIGHAAFAAIPSNIIGNLSNSPPPQASTADVKVAPLPENGVAAPENGAAKVEETPKEQTPLSPPARTASPGFLSRAQGMLSGFLARPASPAAKLPAPDAPTTTGEAALVGGGAVAATANEVGDKIASGQDLGGHDPKGVLGDEPNLLSEGTATRTGLPEGTNTAAKFLDPNIATPDPSKPPQDPGLSGSVFPVLADDPTKDKSKAKQPTSPSQPITSTTSSDDVQAAVNKPIPGSTPLASPGEGSEADRPQPTVTKVSGSGVMDQILNVRDTVVAPFQGSRAPNSDGPQPDLKTPDSGSGIAHVDQSNKTSGNAEAIRTTENPHTAHTDLAPVRESGASVGGTGVASPKTSTGGADGKNLDGTSPGLGNGTTGNGTTGNGVVPESNGAADLTHIPGVSIQGNGTGKVVVHDDGAIKSAEAAQAEREKEKEKEKSGSGGVSRLWSRSSRTSVDAGGRRGSVDEASKSPTGTRRSKSRFNEEGAPTGSESGSTPASPSSSRFKVPLKDKIKGELKIISGKMSKNEAKIEQGIALKTGHASEGAVSPK